MGDLLAVGIDMEGDWDLRDMLPSRKTDIQSSFSLRGDFSMIQERCSL